MKRRDGNVKVWGCFFLAVLSVNLNLEVQEGVLDADLQKVAKKLLKTATTFERIFSLLEEYKKVF